MKLKIYIIFLSLLFIFTFPLNKEEKKKKNKKENLSWIGVAVNPINLSKNIYTLEFDCHSFVLVSGTYLYHDIGIKKDFFLTLNYFYLLG